MGLLSQLIGVNTRKGKTHEQREAASPHLSPILKESIVFVLVDGPEKAAPCVIYGLSRNASDKNGGGLYDDRV